MAATAVEILVDLPPGVVICEYERIDDGHAFHVGWDFPAHCVCETCKTQRPLNLVEKAKFLTIRDLEIWGQPSFFVYQEMYHRCPACGHRQSLIPPFKRKDVKYTFRFEELVLSSLIKSTAERRESCQAVGYLARNGGTDRPKPDRGHQGQEGRSQPRDQEYRYG